MPRNLAHNARTVPRARRLAAAGAALLAAATLASCAGGGTSTAGVTWAGRDVVTAAAYRVPGGRAAPPGTAVLTQRGSNSRVGWNSHETILNSHNVSAAGFGKRVAYPVAGKIYAQPLFVPGLRVDGRVHNVVIVATETDNVYAFDADASGTGPAPLWHTSFLVHGAVPVPDSTLSCTSIVPSFGITGTPVIDRATGTLYLITAMKAGGVVTDYLHAISISTGRDRIPPVRIAASVRGTGLGSHGGVLAFSAREEQQHMALLLDHGVVYAGFASYCDRDPFHGWILGYRASDLHRVVVYNTTPNGVNGGVWQSATGLAANQAGDLIFITGDGSYNLAAGGRDVSDSVLEMRPEHGTLAVVQYFTPFYQACLAAKDQDYGSGAPLLLPGEIIAIGKEGAINVLSRARFGGYHTIAHPCQHMNRTDVDNIVQELPPQTVVGGVWSAETSWAGASGRYVYTAGEADHLKAWRLVGGKLVSPPASRAAQRLDYPGGIPVGSSDGGRPSTAIVWILDQEKGPALRAYAAGNLAHELYSSQQDPGRDAIPGYDNFCLPTVADGRVFVGTAGELLIYGLLH
ncbi:MAG TPA: hypothetical protein VGM53_30240 [Streptosporangiaceae bacterium]|jgi:hypothetical protein